jgi:hypothetical protein
MWNGLYHGILVRAKAWGVATTVIKTTQLTRETSRVQIIRRLRSSRNWCPQCAREVDGVGLEEAVVLTGLTLLELQGCVGTGKWHFCKSSDESQLICLDSLMNSLNEK